MCYIHLFKHTSRSVCVTYIFPHTMQWGKDVSQTFLETDVFTLSQFHVIPIVHQPENWSPFTCSGLQLTRRILCKILI